MDRDKTASRTVHVQVRKRILESDFVLDVDFHAAPGFTILFGASGAGKTTLLDCIEGLVEPDSGRISIGELALFDASGQVRLPVENRNIGYVFQDLALFPHLTVEENVDYGLSHLPGAERRQRSEAILSAFRIPH